jgi:diguanylate cyclase (GGDEF)-like protein
MNLENINHSSICALLNTNGEFLSFSKKYEEVAEVDHSFIGKNHFTIFNREPKNKEIFFKVVHSGIAHVIHSKSFQVDNMTNQCGDMGSWILLPIFDTKGEVIQILLSYIHVEEMDYIHNLKADIDYLTSLYNRNGIEQQLEKYIDNQESFLLLFLDLNKFKLINDTYGHDIGDELLKIIGKKLIACVKHDDFVGRLGGDEFIVIVKTDQPQLIKNALVQRIYQHIETPFYIDNNEFTVSTSIGVAEYPNNGTTIKELFNFADQLMYKDKNHF